MPATTPAPALDARALLRFQGPLMLNAWLLTLVGPVLSMALGRGPDARVELAGFWLAFSVVVVVQSACAVLPQATAVARMRHAPLPGVLLGAGLLGACASAIVLAAALTPAGAWLLARLVPAAPEVALRARAALVPLAALPLLVALRGVAAGVASTSRCTERLLQGTAVRGLALGVALGLTLAAGAGAGAGPAAWAMVLATGTEAAFLAAATLPGAHAPGAGTGLAASPRPVLAAALPLAASAVVWTLERPLVAAVLGRLADPTLALAALGVVLPLLFSTCAPLWTFLEGAVVLPRAPGDLRRLARFAAATAAVFAAALALVAFTPLREALVVRPFALGPALARAVRPGLAILAAEPLALTARVLAQGVLVRRGRGRTMVALALVKLPVLLAGGLLVVHRWPHAPAGALALAAFVAGDAIDALAFCAALAPWRTAAAEPVAGGSPAVEEAA